MTTNYRQRAKVTPPHISLSDLRAALGLTLDQVCQRYAEVTKGQTITRGALSAIENGHRGASADVLAGLSMALGMRADALTTEYHPRTGRAA